MRESPSLPPIRAQNKTPLPPLLRLRGPLDPCSADNVAHKQQLFKTEY